jgi:hypothetical protein
MTIYTVLAPPAEPGPDGPDPDGFVFVKEGFCWPAFYLTVPWLVWRRMWLVFLIYVAITLTFFSIIEQVDLPVAWLIHVLFGFLVALEANNLRRWTLERRGYRFLGVVSGSNAGEAEFRFFASWVEAPAGQLPLEPLKPVTPGPIEASEVVGLFPMPGGGR